MKLEHQRAWNKFARNLIRCIGLVVALDSLSLLPATAVSAFVPKLNRRPSSILARGILPSNSMTAGDQQAVCNDHKNMSSATTSPIIVDGRRASLLFDDDCLQEDTYQGITLLLEHLDESFHDPNTFQKALAAALDVWTHGITDDDTEHNTKKRGVWVHVPKRLSHLIPSIMEHDFEFHDVVHHHQQQQQQHHGVLILKKWLLPSPSRLPFGPTHQVGVGALVIRKSDGHMLVVQEKTGPAAKRKLWKMPTGLLDPGEDIGDAAIRELQEETGLDACMERIVCMRQAHNHNTNQTSDLFFICLMKLVDESQTPSLQEEEIADLKWMPFHDYASQELWQGSPVYQEMNVNIERALQDARAGMLPDTLPVGFRPGTNTLYKSNI